MAGLIKMFGSCHSTNPKNYLKYAIRGSESPFSTSCNLYKLIEHKSFLYVIHRIKSETCFRAGNPDFLDKSNQTNKFEAGQNSKMANANLAPAINERKNQNSLLAWEQGIIFCRSTDQPTDPFFKDKMTGTKHFYETRLYKNIDFLINYMIFLL